MKFGKYKEMCIILHCISYVLSEFNKCSCLVIYLIPCLPRPSKLLLNFLLAFLWRVCLFRKSVKQRILYFESIAITPPPYILEEQQSCKSLAISLRFLLAFNVQKLCMYRWLPSSSSHITHFVVSLVPTSRARLVPQSTTSCLSVAGLLQRACFSFLLLFLTWIC